MAVPADFNPRVSSIAGLMDWVGAKPPTEDALGGGRVLEQGSAHIKTITETGGQVLGARPLELDVLAAAADPRELSTKGIVYIARRAERLFNTTSG